MNYTVRKVKTFTGHDGQGFNAELCRDGKPVAFCTDLANGGEMQIDWYDRKEPKVKIQGWNYKDEIFEYDGTPEEKILKDHCKTLPVEKMDWGTIREDASSVVSGLVDGYENEKKFKRMCKKNTLMKNKLGIIHSIKIPFTPQIKEKLLQKYPDIVEFLNERYA